jgi:glycerophosphoryl diester phosphodiesterase
MKPLAASALALALLVRFWGAPCLAVEIIAHRGASHDAPENTLAAFKLGWEQQAEAVELDISLSKDGHVIVLHDADTRRTTGADHKVSQASLAELQSLDAGSWKGPQWKGEKIPMLSDAVALVPEGRRLFIEIKCGPEVLPALERVISASGKRPGQLVIIGFGYDTMQAAKKLLPRHEVYWLVSPKKESQGRLPTVEEMVRKAKAASLDGLNLNFQFPMDPGFVAKVREAGLKLYAWTVNDAKIARRLAEAGVDGITTDRPAWLREQLK